MSNGIPVPRLDKALEQFALLVFNVLWEFSERAVKTGHARRIRDVDSVSSIETARSLVAYKGLAAFILLRKGHGNGLARVIGLRHAGTARRAFRMAE